MGAVIGLYAEVRFCRMIAKPKGILGVSAWDSTQGWISLPRASLR